MVRRLQYTQLAVPEEPAHGQLQKRARRHVVTVKDRDKLAVHLFQRVVDIARFGVFMRRASDVMYGDDVGEPP